MAVGPSLKQLIIPNKSKKKVKGKTAQGKDHPAVAQDDYSTDMRTIETWAQYVQSQLDNISPSGGYASLTGPGETTTPGALTQDGNFFINGNLASAGTGTLTWSSGTTIALTSGSTMNIFAGSTMALTATTTMTINGSTVHINGAGIFIVGTGGVTIGLSGSTEISFSSGEIAIIATAGGRHVDITTTSSVAPTADDGSMLWDLEPSGVSGTGYVQVFTAPSTASLPALSSGVPAFAFTRDGHLSFSTGSGGWTTLV